MTNTVVLMGNLVSDPDIRVTNSDKTVASFRVANNRRFGETEKTVFVDCTAFGATGDFVADYMKKGSRVVVTGHLEMNEWDDNAGNHRQKIEIICERVDFAGSKPEQKEDKKASRSNRRR